MSLFGNSEYQYRETYFLLFNQENRPQSSQLEAAFAELGSKYQVVEKRESEDRLESMTVKSPYDFAAMDITYVAGDEVSTQVNEIMEEFRTITLIGDDRKKLDQLRECDARFDIFHFEQIVDAGNTNEEFLDPGGLLIVLEKLAGLCQGVGYDPQSQSLM